MGWQRHEILTLLAVAAIVVLTIGIAHFAPGAPPHPAAVPLRAEDDPRCQEWTDGCVVCQRTPQGPACSTPGIACVRGPQECVRRAGA